MEIRNQEGQNMSQQNNNDGMMCQGSVGSGHEEKIHYDGHNQYKRYQCKTHNIILYQLSGTKNLFGCVVLDLIRLYFCFGQYSKEAPHLPPPIPAPQNAMVLKNTSSVVRLDSLNRTVHTTSTIMKEDHLADNSIDSLPIPHNYATGINDPANTTPLAQQPLAFPPMISRVPGKPTGEERIRRKIKKAKQAVRKRRPRWLKVTMQNFSIFCNQTSLHGWQYIAQAHTSSLKHIFWALIVSLSMATAALFLYNNTMDYLHATVCATFLAFTFKCVPVY